MNVGGKRRPLWHDSVHTLKEEKQKCLQERRMNDEQTSGVCEAEATCLPVEMRTARLCSKRGEQLPLPSSCRPVSCLQSLMKEQLLWA